MTNIIIKEENKTINLMTKKFANAAQRFGTPEYEELQQVRKAYPGFKVVTKKTTKKTDGFKGLTYDFMEKYIASHDNAKENKAIFDYLRTGDVENDIEPYTYGEIKKWFVGTYPEVVVRRKSIDDILKTA